MLIFKYTVFSSGSFCQIYRVTDEASIAKTAVWPNFFLMNVFFGLKGSKLFIIICRFLFLTAPFFEACVSDTLARYEAGITVSIFFVQGLRVSSVHELV